VFGIYSERTYFSDIVPHDMQCAAGDDLLIFLDDNEIPQSGIYLET
jgi:hypothetical protein